MATYTGTVNFAGRPSINMDWTITTIDQPANSRTRVEILVEADPDAGNTFTPYSDAGSHSINFPKATNPTSSGTWALDFRSPNTLTTQTIVNTARFVPYGSGTTATLRIQADGGGSTLGAADSGTITIDIFDAVVVDPPAAFSNTPYVSGTTGSSYNDVVISVGATSITRSGALPPGLSGAFEDATDGYRVTGTPTTAGTYNFTLTSSNAGGTQTYNASIVISDPLPPPPDTPTGLFIDNETQTQLRLNWDTAGGDVTDYQITRQQLPSGTVTNAGTTSNTFFTVTGLTAGTSYRLAVRARGPGGNSGYASTDGTTLPATFTVPNVVGTLRDNAITTLTNAGFTSPVNVTLTTSGATSTNNRRVISQTPVSGSTATVGDTASINIYNYLLSVPNILGLTQNEANTALTNAGFTLYASSLNTAGATVANNLTVRSQSPTGGTLANPADQVTFTIFNFLTQVPNVVGQQTETALANLSAVGFTNVTITVDEVNVTLANNNTVKSQNPVNSATTYNPKNTPVSLVIYRFGIRGRRRTEAGFQLLTNAKRFDGQQWITLSTQKRFNGISWVDLT